MTQIIGFCWKTGKESFTREGAAKRVQGFKKNNPKYSSSYKYRCVFCGEWHITSNKPKKEKARRVRPVKLLLSEAGEAE